MVIHGLEKLSLVDFNNLTCATVFTGSCNFRCPFCHNATLVLDPASQPTIPEAEIFSYLDGRKGLLDGVCITGGEPTLQRDLIPFMLRIKEKGFLVKLDTNGSFPAVLRAAVEAGAVDYVAMDIKNSLEKYPITAGISDTAPILESIAFLKSGAVPHEFRTTLVAELHDARDMEKIAALVEGCPRYFLQAFADKGNCIEAGLTAVPKQTAETFAAILAPHVGTVALRGY